MGPGHKQTASLVASAAIGLASLSPFLGAARDEFPSDPAGSARPDLRHVVGPDECAGCHELEAAVWEKTGHHTGGRDLARSDEARTIATALGIRRLKTEDRCTACHFTVRESHKGDLETISGVSCESCHGPGDAWIDLHPPMASETAPERALRLKRCDQLGMRRPAQLYDLASSCYGCHVITDEEVVNTGGHPAVVGLDLVAGTQGSLRHNYVRGDEGTNAVSALERRRVMFVLGHALTLEHTLRALARSTQEGPYRDGMLESVRAARAALTEVQLVLPLELVATILESSRAFDVNPAVIPMPAELNCLADEVGATTRAFERGHDGTELGALDPLLPVVQRE